MLPAGRPLPGSHRQPMPPLWCGCASAELTLAQDWTASGVASLVVHFQGAEGNGGQLYVKINGTKVPYPGDAGDITSAAGPGPAANEEEA